MKEDKRLLFFSNLSFPNFVPEMEQNYDFGATLSTLIRIHFSGFLQQTRLKIKEKGHLKEWYMLHEGTNNQSIIREKGCLT